MTEATLKTFFCDDAAEAIYGSCEAVAARKAVDAAIKSIPRAAQPGLAKSVEAALDEVFHVPLAGILAGSWKKIATLQEALKKTRADPNSAVFVPLLEHKVTSKHRPRIDLMMGPKQLGQLVFDIALTLELKGVELEIRNGLIAGLKGGECKGQGVFSYDGQELIKRDTKAFPLAGRLTFEAGG